MTNKRKRLNLMRLIKQVTNELKNVEIGSDLERNLLVELEGLQDELSGETQYEVRRYAYRLDRLYAANVESSIKSATNKRKFR